MNDYYVLVSLLKEIFGHPHEAMDWLLSYNPILGEVPLELLISDNCGNVNTILEGIMARAADA